MNGVDRDGVAQYATPLDTLWSEGKDVLASPRGNTCEQRTTRAVKLKSIAKDMAQTLDELLGLPIHMGGAQPKQYQELESLMVTTVIRIMNLDRKTGIRYKKLFNEKTRSLAASSRLLWATFRTRVATKFDDDRH